jgi:hypothetical protein
MIFAIALAVLLHAVNFEPLLAKANFTKAQRLWQPDAAVATKESKQAIQNIPTPARSALVPTSYGVYAVSQGKLYELDLLQGRAPDIRVAISYAILTPSRTILPDGYLKFIVFRRDSATSAADRAEIRIIAKINGTRDTDRTDKSTASKAENVWAIRNISTPYRTAPSKDSPDLYEIQSESPETPLSPGRYALILKGQSYDFSIAGLVTDPRQCLERLTPENGQSYPECKIH